MTVDQYGTFDFYLSLSTLTTILIVFGQDSAIGRFFFDCESEDEKRALVSQSFLLQCSLVAVLIPVGLLLSSAAEPLLPETSDSSRLFSLALAQVPFYLMLGFTQNLLKWTFEKWKFLIISLGFAACNSLLLVSLALLKASVADLLTVGVGVGALFAVICLYVVKSWLIWPADLKFLKRLLPFAIPVGVLSVIGVLSPVVERLIISDRLGLDHLGIYAAAVKVAMLIELLIQSFQTAWGPYAYSTYQEENSQEMFNLIIKIFTLLACLASLGIGLLSYPLVVVLASEKYSAAAGLILPLTMALCIQGVSWMTGLGISLSKKTHLYVYAYSLGLLGAVGTMYASIDNFGIMGVAFGVLAGQVVRGIAVTALAQAVYPICWQFGKILVLLIPTFMGMAAGAAMWVLDASVSSIALMLVMVAAALLFLSGVYIFDQREKQILSGVKAIGIKSANATHSGLK